MSRRVTIHDLAEALTIMCTDETIADLMNNTLAAAQDDRLTDYQADLAEAFFDSLTELRPDCVLIAQNGRHESPRKRTVWQWLCGA